MICNVVSRSERATRRTSTNRRMQSEIPVTITRIFLDPSQDDISPRINLPSVGVDRATPSAPTVTLKTISAGGIAFRTGTTSRSGSTFCNCHLQPTGHFIIRAYVWSANGTIQQRQDFLTRYHQKARLINQQSPSRVNLERRH